MIVIDCSSNWFKIISTAKKSTTSLTQLFVCLLNILSKPKTIFSFIGKDNKGKEVCPTVARDICHVDVRREHIFVEFLYNELTWN